MNLAPLAKVLAPFVAPLLKLLGAKAPAPGPDVPKIEPKRRQRPRPRQPGGK